MSNYTPEECFPSANEHGKLEPLLDRITVVKCEGPIRIVEGQPAEDFATCSTSFDWPDEDLPPPLGSIPVLTDDYSEIFPETPPEYEVLDDDPPVSARVCNARPQQSTYLHIFLKVARPTLAIMETQTTAWKTKCQLKKRRQFEDPLRQCLIPPLILIVITTLTTSIKSHVRVALQCLQPEIFNKS